jgi:hypothetical protein
MDVWIRKCSSFEEEELADLEYWDSMQPEQRLAALEQMRREPKVGDGHFEGLRRVIRRAALGED